MNATIGVETVEPRRRMASGHTRVPWIFFIRDRDSSASGCGVAYRPFDGTDAAVADPGEMEVELQPAGEGAARVRKTLVAPATVINYGFAKNWEAVLEGRLETPLPDFRANDFHRRRSHS